MTTAIISEVCQALEGGRMLLVEGALGSQAPALAKGQIKDRLRRTSDRG